MKYPWIYIFLQSIYLICNIDAKSLDGFIQHYEELDYSTNDLQSSHLRSKRSLTNEPFQFSFDAFQRNFIIVLQQDKSVFNKDAALNTPGPLDTSHIYVGHVKGCEGSRVFGYIVDGYFHGSIKIPQETTYHIEPNKRFIGKVKEVPKAHSVIYKEGNIASDLKRFQKESNIKVDSSWEVKVHQWMQNETKSSHTDRDERYDSNRESKNPQLNNRNGTLDRHKRGTLVGKNACFLYMQADLMLFNRINSAYQNEVLAKQYIIGLFATHVDAINTIYSNTVFKTYDNTINYSGVRFKIQRIKIMTDATEKCSTSQASKFCENNTNVVNFLNLHSQSDYDAFCLAYTFTYRDFLHGSLGLAWMAYTAYTGQNSGGICEKHKLFSRNGLPVMKSLNSGVVTLLNYGNDVPPRVSQLSFAHQVGHNFGSPHDSGTLCAPYGTSAVDAELGNYIMNDGSTTGNKNNNDKFSPCSKDNITRIMDAVFNGRYGKRNCFQHDNAAFCGNNVVEAGEQCDCGYAEDCTDKCCSGRDSNGNGCTLTAGSSCSPSQGSCCDPQTCAPVTDGRQCIPETDCAAASYCTGQVSCPISVAKPSYVTYCKNHLKVCVDGLCTGSVCSKIDFVNQNKVTWVECLVESYGDTVANKEKQCLLGCKVNNTYTCSSSDGDLKLGPFLLLLQEIKNATLSENVKLSAGSPCNNYRGYCDTFQRCQDVIEKMDNSAESISDTQCWIFKHWWIVLLLAKGLV